MPVFDRSQPTVSVSVPVPTPVPAPQPVQPPQPVAQPQPVQQANAGQDFLVGGETKKPSAPKPAPKKHVSYVVPFLS